ncbi:plasmid replication protein RepC [Methylobacterium carpenticola]|uniref:plasmid replication protein RepC n=1 Tax=Methylobacterium carpenticola TaxID=3344827 RepID=UPI003F882353
MEQHKPTTPFGRRPLALAHVASEAVANARPPEKAAHKWDVFRAICAARERIGVSARALAVLDALLSFHPETVLTGESLVVWPSNRQLALRAHGMAPATLRRHLAALVEAGLILRRDSPNGKRYARKNRGGEVALAFGFDLGPLVARAEAFEALAAEVEAEARALRLLRERISLCRRDIAKMIATGIEEGISARRPAGWAEIDALYRGLVGRIPRSADRAALEPIAEDLSGLAGEVLNLLKDHAKTRFLGASESQDERHKQNSDSESPVESEPGCRGGRVREPHPRGPAAGMPERSYPLDLVLCACPDIATYAKGGIGTWRDLAAAVALVRPMLGSAPMPGTRRGPSWATRPPRSRSRPSCSAAARSGRPAATCAPCPAKPGPVSSRSGPCSWRWSAGTCGRRSGGRHRPDPPGRDRDRRSDGGATCEPSPGFPLARRGEGKPAATLAGAARKGG